MAKLKQKISGCFRSAQGADAVAVIRTLIGTPKKQGWGVIQSLMQHPEHLIKSLGASRPNQSDLANTNKV